MDKIEQKMYDVASVMPEYAAKKCAAITQEVAVGFLVWYEMLTPMEAVTLKEQGVGNIDALYTHYINTIYNGE